MHADRLAGLLRALGLATSVLAHGEVGDLFSASSSRPSSSPGAPLAVLVGPLRRGFALPADRLIVVAEEEIFGARASREVRPASKASGLGDLGEIAEGDLVVHDEHGIGRYRGLKKLTVRGVPQDFLQLEYDGGAIYLPVYRIGLVNRYSGGETEGVRLDKLGARTWQEKRRRVSAEVRKIADELLQLYAERPALAGYALPAADAVFRAFEETFPFDETPDQAKAIETVVAEMENARPIGSPRLRRRRLRQDRGGAAGDADGGAGGQAGGGAGADHGLGRAALPHLLRALRRFPGARRGDVALPDQGRAAGDARGAGKGSSTSSWGHIGSCRTTFASTTSASWSSTKSSGSA